MDVISSLTGAGVCIVVIVSVYFFTRSKSFSNLREYVNILSMAPFPVIILDQSDTTLLFINNLASQMLGAFSPELGSHLHLDFFVDMSKKEELLTILKTNGSVKDFEIQICSQQGRVLCTLVSATLIIIDEKPAIFLVFTDITHQKELETATQQNKELYKSILRTSPDPIVLVDTLGKIFMLSPSAFQILGYSLKEHYPYGMYFLNFIHPSDQSRAKQDLRELKNGTNTGPNEYRAVKRDGTIISIESHSEVIRDQNGKPDSILYIVRDITKRKEVEMMIRENEERFTTIFQEVPDPLIIVNTEGKILDMNYQCERWFSVNKNQYLWNTLQEIGFLQSEIAESTLMDTILGLAPGEKIETKVILPDETERYAIISTRMITISGSPAFLIMIHDIDDIKRAYQALTLANNQINLLNSITRHDILNKVMVITGYSEILREDSTDQHTQMILSNISISGNDIKNLIEFTKEYQDLGIAKPRWHAIHQMIDRPVISSVLSGITLTLPDEPIEIYADPMLEKVLYNLIENSKRHGGNVSRISLSYHLSELSCILIYADNGQGIADSDKEKIFQKGFGKNTGLGLFIIREILSITGLSIRECGVQGEGVRFEISIPFGKFRLMQSESDIPD